MTTVRVSLPDDLTAFVLEIADREDYSSASAYIRALIQADQQRRQESARTAPPGGNFDYEWQELRDRVHARSDTGWIRE